MLEIDGLAKRYKGGAGVGPVSCLFEDGQAYAIVGPNGAGKTTLFSILAGIISADEGGWRLDALAEEAADYACSHVGYLPEKPYFFPSFTVRQFYAFDTCMKGLGLSKGQIEDDLANFGCMDYVDERIGSLSQGMAKRLMIACAFAGDPELILLDEPLNAIDIQTTIALKGHIARVKERGVIVLMSSHVLDFVDEVADRVIFLKDGLVDCSFDPHIKNAEAVYAERFL